MKRRKFIASTLAVSAGTIAHLEALPVTNFSQKSSELKNNIHHSACHWCYEDIPMEELLQHFNTLGIKAMDLVGPEEWPLLKKYNIHASMCWGAELGLTDGWCDPKFHAQLIKNYSEMIPKVAEAGYTNLICFSGNRRGMDDSVGLQNCANGLKQILPLAEKHNVIIHMELLNSKIDHADYMCDHTSWGVELCEKLNSSHFKLLYDIYHMQIMEGDIIRNIQDYHQYIGHYHTGGNPGRHEIDETQELFYPAIMKAILKTGYKGYVAQEFVPTWDDPIASLKQAITICDV